MDIEAIRAFLTISETGSFSLAAEKLHLTQPAVSKRIALLESQMGARLFDRIGRTVNLTEAGRELEPRAREILIKVEDTRRAIRDLSGEVSGSLSVATSHHIGLWRLPPVLKAYTARYPPVALDLHFMDSAVAHEQIVQGNLELGIVTLAPTVYEKLDSLPIWHDELTFVCAPDHTLAGQSPVTLAELSAHSAILPDMSTFTGRIVKRLFDEHGLPLAVGMSTNFLETIKMLISIGLGWSVLPRIMLDETTHRLDVYGASLARTLGVIYHPRRTLSNAGRAFLSVLEEHTDD